MVFKTRVATSPKFEKDMFADTLVIIGTMLWTF